MSSVQSEGQSSQTIGVISIVLSVLAVICAVIAAVCYFWLEAEKRGVQVDDNNTQVITNGFIWMLQLAVSIVGKLVGGTVAVIGSVLGVISLAQKPNKTAIVSLLLCLIAIIVLGSIQVFG